MRITLQIFALFLIFGLAGCGSTLPKVDSYKLDIPQGNVVTSKMLLKLRPGMSKSQVKFIMGTPLIIDGFHNDRWDYFYQLRQNGQVVKRRRVILDFENEVLARVRGDVVAKGTPGAVSGEEQVSRSTAKKETEDKGVLEKLKFWNKDKEEAPALNETEEGGMLEAEVPVLSAEAQAAAEVQAAAQAAEAAEETESVIAVPPPQLEDVPAAPEVAASAIEATPSVESTAKEVVGEGVAATTEEIVAPVTEAEVSTGEEAEIAQTVIMPAATDDRLVFRMDRNLDMRRLEAVPAEVALEPIEAAKEIPEPAEDPGFFERMLEKIGF